MASGIHSVKQALSASDGIASPQAYGQLLAIYLLQNDLVNAKLLWRRIPYDIKQSHLDLGQIWKVGQAMWKKNFPAVHAALSQEWPDDLKPIMQELNERMRMRALMLVGKAYTSISVEDTCSFLAVPKHELASFVSPLGWVVDFASGMVSPKPIAVTHDSGAYEEHMIRLTNFASFFES